MQQTLKPNIGDVENRLTRTRPEEAHRFTGSWRRLHALTAAVLCVVLLLSAAAGADDPLSTDPFPIGWYDALSAWHDPAYMLERGSNISLAYWGSSTAISRNQYLNEAAAGGMRVIMEIPSVLVETEDVAGIRDVVSTYDSYPAVVGWYSYDEPYSAWGIPFSRMQIAYDAIKQESSKPVVICFAPPAMAEGRNIPLLWKSAYDIIFADSYPCRTGYPEFTGLEIMPPEYPYADDWKGDMQRANEQSQLADRPWWSVLQGWGSNVGETGNYRLPTYNEARFMNYYSSLENTSGLIHFAYYRTGHVGVVPAQPDEAYPYDGMRWLDEVYNPSIL